MLTKPVSQVLLSAMLYSIPFFFPYYLGFLIVFFPVPLVFLFLQKQITPKRTLFYGFLWGVIVFTAHLFWVFFILYHFSCAHIFLSLLLYGLLVFYFSLTSSIWFFITSIFCCLFETRGRLSVVVLTTVGYVMFLIFFSTWFLSCTKGNPFLSPLIPLTSSFGFLEKQSTHKMYENKDGEFAYLTPDKSVFAKHPEKRRVIDLLAITQNLYHQITHAKKNKTKNRRIFCTPEGVLPCALNERPELLQILQAALQKGDCLLLCAQRSEKKNGKVKRYQTIYGIDTCRIIFNYDKTNLIDFTEKIPKRLRNSTSLSTLFSQTKSFFSRGKHEKNTIALCSEAFFTDWLSKHKKNNPDLCIALVNDSWFPDYFKKILRSFLSMKAYYYGKNVLYVGYDGMKVL